MTLCNDVGFPTVITESTVTSSWYYPIKRRITFASALEFCIYVNLQCMGLIALTCEFGDNCLQICHLGSRIWFYGCRFILWQHISRAIKCNLGYEPTRSNIVLWCRVSASKLHYACICRCIMGNLVKKQRTIGPVWLTWVLKICWIRTNLVGGWVGQWCWVASVLGRSTTFAYGRAGACCACSRCGTGGLFLFYFFI